MIRETRATNRRPGMGSSRLIPISIFITPRSLLSAIIYVITYNKVTREMREDTTLSKSTYILAQLLH
uniref:Uncharacterized protein n=1 Tax=Picea glauca TaxID=3330 RepID=A0A101LU68_PICGL|nr:hypothetical protein ABT39_MTgene2696 [Picea glauca]QHR87247.1 hypothetical protein Q903MT_gene1256 [Picea sitchensis]